MKRALKEKAEELGQQGVRKARKCDTLGTYWRETSKEDENQAKLAAGPNYVSTKE